ncbi:hypothetical protein SS50377_20115 [Spironucleus salmonicida]|uniref:RING-type domain-containing protein n=1 Tax=Spironucleus salmonicida TaxID=348837 RepID=V6LN89_9EUKA|nr:hypothetical protein SS50377_20115 [Spironucleus salmonicida]|eukprot:EST45171.1 hypothetical protein SS50377_14744 [Spironucleus salmonicida]
MSGHITLEDIENLDNEIEETLQYLDNDTTEFLDQQTMTRVSFKKQKKYLIKNILITDEKKKVNIGVKYINQEVQQVILQQLCFCSVCLEPFQFPVTLPCNHTICSLCLHRSNILWSFKKCPCCGDEYDEFLHNILLQNDVSQYLKRHVLAELDQCVVVLQKYEKVNPYTLGFFTKIENGYIKENMREWIQSDIILEDQNLIQPKSDKIKKNKKDPRACIEQEQPLKFMPVKIATVALASQKWKGILNSIFPINFKYYPICTRPIRGGFVIQRANIKIVDKFFIGDNDIDVYDPEMPKFLQFTNQYLNFDKNSNIFMLIADEPVLNTVTLIKNNTSTSSTNLETYLRIGINFQSNFNSQFICPACKFYYRVPVQLICGCNCCFTCARDLLSLKLPCLGCGKDISKKYGLNSVNKKLILQMYSKIPSHSPMIDRAMPVMIDDQVSILIDDPNRVNCWVLQGPSQTTYVHTVKLQAINVTKLVTALRPRIGMIYMDKDFGILLQEKDQFIICSRNQIQGAVVEAQMLLLNGFKLIDDIRTEILEQKQRGKIQQIKDKELEYEEIKQKVQQKIIEQNQKEAEKRSQLENKKQFMIDIVEERRKRLNLVQYNDPKQKYHPCNQIVEIVKQDLKEKVCYIQKQQKNWVLDLTFKNPDLPFLCSGCWELIKQPVILRCGHSCCRICACIYIQAQIPCLVCGLQLDTMQDIPYDTDLNNQLIVKIPEKDYKNGLDLGVFVSFKEQIFMITKVHQEICVGYSKGLFKTLKISKITIKQPGMSNIQEVELFNSIIVKDGTYQGFYGVYIAQNKVLLETGIEVDINIDKIMNVAMVNQLLSTEEIKLQYKQQESLRRNAIALGIKHMLLGIDQDVQEQQSNYQKPQIKSSRSKGSIGSKKVSQKYISSQRQNNRK